MNGSRYQPLNLIKRDEFPGMGVIAISEKAFIPVIMLPDGTYDTFVSRVPTGEYHQALVGFYDNGADPEKRAWDFIKEQFDLRHEKQKAYTTGR